MTEDLFDLRAHVERVALELVRVRRLTSRGFASQPSMCGLLSRREDRRDGVGVDDLKGSISPIRVCGRWKVTRRDRAVGSGRLSLPLTSRPMKVRSR